MTWQERAACRGKPLETVFGRATEEAWRMCQACPVRDDCAAAGHRQAAKPPGPRCAMCGCRVSSGRYRRCQSCAAKLRQARERLARRLSGRSGEVAG